jgi:hypothetical protein
MATIGKSGAPDFSHSRYPPENRRVVWRRPRWWRADSAVLPRRRRRGGRWSVFRTPLDDAPSRPRASSRRCGAFPPGSSGDGDGAAGASVVPDGGVPTAQSSPDGGGGWGGGPSSEPRSTTPPRARARPPAIAAPSPQDRPAMAMAWRARALSPTEACRRRSPPPGGGGGWGGGPSSEPRSTTPPRARARPPAVAAPSPRDRPAMKMAQWARVLSPTEACQRRSPPWRERRVGRRAVFRIPPDYTPSRSRSFFSRW